MDPELYQCKSCQIMVDYYMQDGKSGICGDCFICAECNPECGCDASDSDYTTETESESESEPESE